MKACANEMAAGLFYFPLPFPLHSPRKLRIKFPHPFACGDVTFRGKRQ